MAYKVIKAFSDGQDKMYVYEVGDTYPRQGYKPTKERLNGLLGTGNKQGTPLIEKIEEPKQEELEIKEEIKEEPKKSKKKGK